jgi:hypothetical protein
LSAGIDSEGHLSEWRQEEPLPTACSRPILEFWDQKLWHFAGKVFSAEIGTEGRVRRWAEWQSDLEEGAEEGSVVSAGGKFLRLSGDTAAGFLSPVHLQRPV